VTGPRLPGRQARAAWSIGYIEMPAPYQASLTSEVVT
jgi:hypothetical protein